MLAYHGLSHSQLRSHSSHCNSPPRMHQSPRYHSHSTHRYQHSHSSSHPQSNPADSRHRSHHPDSHFSTQEEIDSHWQPIRPLSASSRRFQTGICPLVEERPTGDAAPAVTVAADVTATAGVESPHQRSGVGTDTLREEAHSWAPVAPRAASRCSIAQRQVEVRACLCNLFQVVRYLSSPDHRILAAAARVRCRSHHRRQNRMMS